MIVTASGIVTRQKAGNISRQGRPATGVCIQSLIENDSVVAVNKIVLPDEDDEIITTSTSPDTGDSMLSLLEDDSVAVNKTAPSGEDVTAMTPEQMLDLKTEE